MSGTKDGGKLAAKKNLERDPEFYARIGAMGGRKGRTGGFASSLVDEKGLTGKERAREWGRVGGRISRRKKRSDMDLAA
jgi:hypothetical protein